jgi:hypothetical protein
VSLWLYLFFLSWLLTTLMVTDSVVWKEVFIYL